VVNFAAAFPTSDDSGCLFASILYDNPFAEGGGGAGGGR
jgi:hypothetical protein